jgi:hypothetical protein
MLVKTDFCETPEEAAQKAIDGKFTIVDLVKRR